MRKLIILSLLCYVGCTNDKTGAGKQGFLTDTLIRNGTPRVVTDQDIRGYKPLDNKNELIGVWASDNKEPLTIDIKADSIYYTEHFESYKYRVKNDSIFISYPDYEFSARVYFRWDTMIMESAYGQSKYYRFDE